MIIRSPRALYPRHRDLLRYGNEPLEEIRNCDVQERTGDDVSVGRCYFYLEDGKICPRHGPLDRFLTCEEWRDSVREALNF